MRSRRVKTAPTRFHGVLPPQWAVYGKVAGNLIVQLRHDEIEDDFVVERRDAWNNRQVVLTGTDGRRATVVAARRSPSGSADVVRVSAPTLAPTGFPFSDVKSRWVDPVPAAPAAAAEFASLRDLNLEALRDQVFLRVEGQARGLRPPQLGAAYGVLSHWTVRDDVCTVVMPTGTGKTETMLALYAHERLQRLLVVVPTDALRDQLGDKFARFGVLKRAGVIGGDVPYPVVGILSKGFEDAAAARQFADCCNVVVTTMHLVGSLTPEITASLVPSFSHVFVDEAHHIPAASWQLMRSTFSGVPLVQFTATPFRNDGKLIDGVCVYRYPLAKAQQAGYFSHIKFRAVQEPDEDAVDVAIARAAVAQLQSDIESGYDHRIMARAGTIAKAEAIARIYEEVGGGFTPVLLHSRMAIGERRERLAALRSGASHIVVCVDMLGEGVDLPALKIAALHDAHRSLTVTLQFVGRFTRTGGAYGSATVVANALDPGFERSLRQLYAEDADWDAIIETLSEDATSNYARREAFARGFNGDLGELALKNIAPKMSTLVFRTDATDWEPRAVLEALAQGETLFAGPVVNADAHTIVWVTLRSDEVSWADVKGFYDATHHLHIAHWNPRTGLFFVQTSDSDNFHRKTANKVVGDSELITGETVFRALAGINRLVVLNLGMRSTVNRRIQYQSMMGTDIAPALSSAERGNKIKWNLFGTGYEQGERTSVGCSQKGRVWSYKVALDVSDWLGWAAHVGQKLSDESIRTDAVLEGAIIPERATERPSGVPITVEWDFEVLQRPEDRVFVEFGTTRRPFFEVGLEITQFSADGPIEFAISSSEESRRYRLVFSAEGVGVESLNGDARLSMGRNSFALSEYFAEHFPIVRFADGSYLLGDVYCKAGGRRLIYDRALIDAWDWDGIDPSKESFVRQGSERTDSIQWRVLQNVLADADAAYDVVFDDDGSGEVADVIAFKISDGQFVLHLFHCKFASSVGARFRIDDLYEVCGQAEKSIRWKRDAQKLFDHLRHRQTLRPRFHRGDLRTLLQLKNASEQSTVACRIHIVQPGLSRASASDDQLELLAATESYLRETFDIDFRVIGAQ